MEEENILGDILTGFERTSPVEDGEIIETKCGVGDQFNKGQEPIRKLDLVHDPDGKVGVLIPKIGFPSFKVNCPVPTCGKPISTNHLKRHWCRLHQTSQRGRLCQRVC